MKHVRGCIIICSLVAGLVVTLPVRTPGQEAKGQISRTDELKEKAGEKGKEGTVEQQTEQRFKVPLFEKAVDPDTYILGPYDHIIVNFIGPEPRSFSLIVLPEGDVFFPGVGGIHADGLSITEFRKRLEEKVRTYFKNIELFCYLHAPRVFRVFVTGEVMRPGAVEVSAVERVSDAIELAGGTTGKSSARLVTLERDGEMHRIDLVRFLVKGDFESNPFLRGGDRIHVHPGGKHAMIFGHIWKSGPYEFIPGETISDLVELAGGFTGEARTDSVLLNRVTATARIVSMMVPASKFDMELKDLDEVYVLDRFNRIRRVFVFGAVRQEGRYRLAEGEGLSDLIARVGRLEELADLDAAYVEKKNGEHMRIDLRAYLSPNAPDDIKLADGDIVTIPAIPQNIVVGGEVKEPGQFGFRNDWTVARYIGLAGGPTENGSIDRVVLVSLDGSLRKAGKNDVPERGDVIVVKRSKAKIFGEFFGGLIRLGTVVISILVLTS